MSSTEGEPTEQTVEQRLTALEIKTTDLDVRVKALENPPPPPPQPPKPPKETGRKKDWGGNPDPNTWNSKKMKRSSDRKLTWKIVDNKDVNIRDLISSEDAANDIIEYEKYMYKPPVVHNCPEGQHWDDVSQSCIENPPPPPPDPECPEGQVWDKAQGKCVEKPPVPEPSGDIDKFGVKSIYPSTGFRIYNYLLKPNQGLRHNFDAVKVPTPNSEVTGYFMIANPPDDEVSGKWSVTTHSDGNHVKCLDIGVDNKTGAARYRYEDPHPNYTKTLATGDKNGAPLSGKYVGYKFIRLTLPDGTVQLETWQDAGNNEGTTPANQWVQLAKWKVAKEYSVTNYPNGVYAVLRLDGAGIEQNLKSKWLSYVEVVPK